MIKTKRLNIYPLSNEQMEQLISSQTIPELKEAFTQMLQGCVDNPNHREWYALWNVELNDESGISVGSLSFKGLGDDGTVEIGYGINSGFENQGYMTQAVSVVIKWAITQENVKMIEAETEPENNASQRVLEKCGFVKNGIIGAEGPRFVWQGQA